MSGGRVRGVFRVKSVEENGKNRDAGRREGQARVEQHARADGREREELGNRSFGVEYEIDGSKEGNLMRWVKGVQEW